MKSVSVIQPGNERMKRWEGPTSGGQSLSSSHFCMTKLCQSDPKTSVPSRSKLFDPKGLSVNRTAHPSGSGGRGLVQAGVGAETGSHLARL